MKAPANQKYLWLLLGIPLSLVLVLWCVQQHNVNLLDQQLDTLQQQIDALPATVAPKDKLALEKDRLTLEKDRVNAQNAIYGTLVQALGGALFIVTAYFTWCNLKVAEENLKVTQEKQVTERFSRAIELLGSKELEVRLGGIYALERIAKDSPKDHWTIMEVLTSFVQEKSPLSQEKQKITTDIQAALTVIGRRDSNKEQGWQRIELPRTNLKEANLTNANLIKANLTNANLSRADLTKANLSKADLTKANLSKADLTNANLSRADLTNAYFSEADAYQGDLIELDDCHSFGLYEETLSDEDYYKAYPGGAKLGGADLTGAKLIQKQISKAIIDEKTKLPDYLQSPKSSQPEPLDPQKP